MLYKNKLILLICIFFNLCLLSAYGMYPREDAVEKVEKKIDLKVEGWEFKNIEDKNKVMGILQTNISIFADYYRQDEELVNLYVGGYRAADAAKMSHAPQVCFTTQGWHILINDKIDLVVATKIIKVNRLLLEKAGEKKLVYYWYQTAKESYAELFLMKLALLKNSLTNREQEDGRNLFVRIITPITNNQEQAAVVLTEYLAPLIQGLEHLFAHQF